MKIKWKERKVDWYLPVSVLRKLKKDSPDFRVIVYRNGCEYIVPCKELEE